MEPDNTIVQAAHARHAALLDRLPEAKQAADAAEAAADEARGALAAIVQRAAAGEAVDPAKAQAEVEAAEANAAFRARVVAHLTAQETEAKAAIVKAHAEAHRCVFEAGRKLRLGAVERADEARAALAVAEADFVRGTAMLNDARAHGWRRELSDLAFPAPSLIDPHERKLPTAARERAFWAEVA